MPKDIFIYDEIGPDYYGLVSANSIIKQIEDAGGDAVVRINSPGGSVYEAQAIHAAIVRHKLRVAIDGVAASAASLLAMGGAKVTASETAMLMIHEPWTIAIGNAAEMRKTADTLDKFTEMLIATYAGKTAGKSSAKQISDWVAAETWMTAAEALARGFIDEIAPGANVSAAIVPSGRFKNTPASLLLLAEDAAKLGDERRRQREQAYLGRKICLTKLRRPA